MAKMKVSRDARQMIDALQVLIDREASIEDVFVAEELAYSYFGKTVVGHIKRMYNPNSANGPDTMAFYVKPTRSLNKGRRNKDEWTLIDEEKRVYYLISNQYLIEDFNYDALKQMREMCQQPYTLIQQAITESLASDVRSVPYLFRIVEGLAIRKEHKRQEIEDRRKLFKGEEDSKIMTRGKAEIANLMYSWEETIQNVELQHKVNKLLKEEK